MTCSCEDCMTTDFFEVFTDRKCLSIEAQWIVAVLTVAGFLVGFAIIECVLVIYFGCKACQHYCMNRSARRSKPRRTGVQVLELDETVGRSKCIEADVIDDYRAQQHGEYTVRVTADPSDYETPTSCPTSALNQSEALYDRLLNAPVAVEHTSYHAVGAGNAMYHAGTKLVASQGRSFTQNQDPKFAATAGVYHVQNTIEGDYDVIRV